MKANAIMLACGLVLLPSLAPQAMAQGNQPIMAEERSEHPRITKAIAALQDAIDYMEHARGDFGGHKADAIEESRKAIRQLHEALAHEARHEEHKD
jgi:hypothetical protein